MRPPRIDLAARTANMNVSAIREILKVVSRPGVVSLAGGIPSPDSFPIDVIESLVPRVLERFGSGALQYDLTEGFPPLREALCGLLEEAGVAASPDDVLIASGSQGVLDGIGKILIDPGDLIAVEAPTYLGAIQAFSPYQPSYVEIATDDDGVIPSALDDALSSNYVKLVYLVPTFQNPTGRTVPLDRRRQIAEIVQRHGVLLLEDDPYGALRFRGEAVPPIASLAPDHVIYMSTLSKVFAPGLRIGYSVAPQPLRDWLVIAKQGVDLHTSTFNQALAAEYIAGGFLSQQVPRIIDIYRPKQEQMMRALAADFPEGFTWSRPDGGMFVWVEGPEGIDIDAVYERSVDTGAAFVPGKYFFTNPQRGLETMRLNFTTAEPEDLSRAIGIIGSAIDDEMGTIR
ncbi:MAG: PLP-dependent aminotransferase family protein [bacterium]|nr:PLP-dependent aminotransferase family protein [bacterium]